jgi:hypothetical protein
VTRYVGTGAGEWRGDWYMYVPSPADWAMARDVAEGIAERERGRQRKRTGWGASGEVQARWYVRGFLGEVAALYPLGSGPDVDAWEGRGWYGTPDYGVRTEVRTTTSWQLGIPEYGKTPRPDTILGGWRVTAKDAGRVILCVCERPDGSFVVYGYAEADAIPRLPAPVGAILAVIEVPELSSFRAILAAAAP